MNYAIILTFTLILFVLAAWYAWRYYKLRRDVDEYASRARGQNISTKIKVLDNLASAVASLITNFNLQHATLDSERARLANVLEQMTDGVLIADSQGIVQFANPAAGRLFQTSN